MSAEHQTEIDAIACECPTDDYCPKCHPRWYAKWRAEQDGEQIVVGRGDAALIVGRDLSRPARALAEADGWTDHARMSPRTAQEYERRAVADQVIRPAATGADQ